MTMEQQLDTNGGGGAASASATTANNANNTNTVFPILHLPYELKRRTASFLSSKDAVRMSLSCKTVR